MCVSIFFHPWVPPVLGTLTACSHCMVLAPSAAPNGKVLCCLLFLGNLALGLLALNRASQLVCKYPLRLQIQECIFFVVSP